MIQTKKASEMSITELASYIDQSVLKPDFTVEEIKKYVQEGIDFGCATVCINPSSLDIVSPMVKGTATKICVVCDFPFGLSTTASKVMQAEEYCKRGDVYELDIVANYGLLKSHLWDEAKADIKAVCDICHSYNVAVKTIMESDALTLEEVKKATEIFMEAGSDFIKTSTGFYTGGECVGASPEIIAEIMKITDGKCKVKGSGCIRTREHFLQLIDMGIDRMGVGFRSTPEVLGLDALKGCCCTSDKGGY